jgi:hypothetical protein
LHQAGSVGRRTHAALIENQRLRRNRIGADNAEAAGGNFDQLRIRQVDEGRVVSQLGKVGALRDLFRTILLIDRQLREADRMVVRQRQVDGLAKCDTPGSRRFGWLGECRGCGRGQEQRKDPNSKCHD